MSKSMLKLSPDRTVFLMCDVQQTLLNNVIDSNNVCLRISYLLNLGKALGIPLMVTEQYSKRLGKTVDSLDISHALCVIDKTSFSMYYGFIADKLAEFRDYSVVLFGIEAHICILQTALDLLSGNYNVLIVTDACSSRSAVDMRVALQRLTSAGVILSTTESLLFELVQTADSQHFNLLKNIVRTHLPDHPALINY
ncbi:hypothetical protein MN116_008664 [Schistosoma mekongi]|uniref:Isochorismatase-like domain-containing protein n=1 Tax=Schistosoma mekongi TaxID=38744 RepID=A0AAE1Z509_SCHME|nr:hypothetical protein MN116_008664 [Schistosoma mekongi]